MNFDNYSKETLLTIPDDFLQKMLLKRLQKYNKNKEKYFQPNSVFINHKNNLNLSKNRLKTSQFSTNNSKSKSKSKIKLDVKPKKHLIKNTRSCKEIPIKTSPNIKRKITKNDNKINVTKENKQTLKKYSCVGAIKKRVPVPKINCYDYLNTEVSQYHNERNFNVKNGVLETTFLDLEKINESTSASTKSNTYINQSSLCANNRSICKEVKKKKLIHNRTKFLTFRQQNNTFNNKSTTNDNERYINLQGYNIHSKSKNVLKSYNNSSLDEENDCKFNEKKYQNLLIRTKLLLLKYQSFIEKYKNFL